MPQTDTNLLPVHDSAGAAPEAGIALCLSGGGYRAMLFHLGCLWRLNEAALLGAIKRVSSVSGGSLTAGALGMNWRALGLSNQTPSATLAKFQDLLVAPIRKIASTTIDEGSILGGIFLSGSISDHVADHYDSLLFHGKTLQDLPDDADGPRFVINATNVQSGVLMRFSKPYMRDFRVGQVLNPALPLARAVAASSAFPPILSPCEIDISRYGLKFEPPGVGEDLNRQPFNTKLVLSDGGVYDNLGLETAWKRYQTIFVSDGGGHYKPEEEPHHDWARHAFRVLDLIDSQVRSLRTRQLIQLFQQKERLGTYWGIRQKISAYSAPPALDCPFDRTTELALTATRLKQMDETLQERLINWGYAICDASLRGYYNTDLALPLGFPYPASKV
jgi:NTE family protein